MIRLPARPYASRSIMPRKRNIAQQGAVFRGIGGVGREFGEPWRLEGSRSEGWLGMGYS